MSVLSRDVENFETVLINTGLQPGATGSKRTNRFNDLQVKKAVKTADSRIDCNTRLKPGVNETSQSNASITASGDATITETLKSLPRLL